MKKAISLPFEKYKPVSHGDAYVYQKYDLLQSFIRKIFDVSFHYLLMKPIKQDEQVDFYTEIDTNLINIEELPAESQQAILKKYNYLLHKIEVKCRELESSQDRDNFDWSTLLKKIFDPQCNIILSDGENIVIAWGWTFENQLNYILPFEAYSDYLNEDLTNKNIVGETNSADEIQNEEAFETLTTSETIEIKEEDEPEKTNLTEKKNEAAKLTKEKKKNSFLRLLDVLEDLFKRFWWIFLLVLLLLIILRFYGCDKIVTKKASEMSMEEITNAYVNIMPAHPGIRTEPIDSSAFKKDDSSGTTIVANLVNIALKNKKDNFKHFAVDLKNAFPDEEFKIVYFDDQTRRIQFSFPKDKQPSISKEIRKKLSDYELLIWDESIFLSSRKFNDPFFDDTKRAWYFDRINAFRAWDICTGNKEITVAIVDDGFDLNHPELKGKAIKPFNVVTDSPSISSGPDRKHGTHVAAIAIGNNNNGTGLSGIAPGCTFMPIQAAGENGYFTQTDIIDAILYAIKNEADVINLSLGKEFASEISLMPENEQKAFAASFGKDESIFWEELFTMAHQNKVSIVLAAGNSNMIIGLDPMQRSSRAIKVMAVGPKEEKAIFSNFISTKAGSSNEIISAPGIAIYSAVPNNHYEALDGTSMAAPIVSGSIALMKSIKPKLSDDQIIKILSGTAKEMKKSNTAKLLQLDKALKKISK
jgi:hypothetical protein